MAKDEKNLKSKDPKNSNKSFLKESKAELKKVSWPKPKRLAIDTTTVIGIVLVVALIVFVLDFVFLEFNNNVIVKGQQKIKDSKNNTVVEQVIDDNTIKTENVDGTVENTETQTEQNAEQNKTENNNAE